PQLFFGTDLLESWFALLRPMWERRVIPASLSRRRAKRYRHQRKNHKDIEESPFRDLKENHFGSQQHLNRVAVTAAFLSLGADRAVGYHQMRNTSPVVICTFFCLVPKYVRK